MSDLDSGNSVNCVLLEVNLQYIMKQREKNNWSTIPISTHPGGFVYGALSYEIRSDAV